MKKACLLMLVFLFMTSCGKLHGEFGFRQPGEQVYKRDLPRYEFDSAKGAEWVYKFDEVSKKSSIGVVILKKEIGWVDIFTTRDYVDEAKRIVYGKISDLEPGDYRLVLTEITTEGNNLIDQREFYIYSDEEPLDEPFDD